MGMPYGAASDYITQVLSEFDFVREYKSGERSKESYLAAMEKHSGVVDAAFEGDSFYRNLASRYPADFDDHADEIYRELIEKGMLDGKVSFADFDEFRERVKTEYDHSSRHTFIHPDEARLVYMISKMVRPKLMITVGSYYGYWAVWAMPGVVEGKGRAVLIDPDASVCALARENFSQLGYGDVSEVVCERAEEVLKTVNDEADLVLLDASGSSEHPDSTYHGKGIYSHLIPRIYEKLRPCGTLAVHNDRNSDKRPDPLKRFHEFCAEHFEMSHTADTPEGFGVYVK